MCVCALHENVNLLLKAHNCLLNDYTQLLNIDIYKRDSHACEINTNVECKDNSRFHQFVKTIPKDQLQEPLKWYQWNKQW